MTNKTIESSFTPSNLNKKTIDNFEKLDRNFAKISRKYKDDLFVKQLKIDYYNKSVDQEIKISNIFSPPAFSRNQHDDEYDDLEIADDLEPIKVVEATDIKGYFIVDGQRRLEYQKQQGGNQIRVLIIGKATCRSQIATARAKEMTNLKRPLNTLELVLGLVQLREVIIADFGEDAFFGHGGNGRKEESKAKQSLSKFIAQATGLKPSSVNVLLNFGRQLGPYGLAGLQNHKDMRNLSIRVINQINSKLKKENLQKEITEMLQSLHGTGSSDRDLIDSVGNLARNAIRIQINKLKESPGSEDDEDEQYEVDEEDDQLPFNTSDYDLPPKQDKKTVVPKVKIKNPHKKSNNSSKNNDSEDKTLNPEQVKNETLKLIKRLTSILNQFENLFRQGNQTEKIVEKYMHKDSEKFNNDAENMILFLKKKITDIKVNL